MRYEVTMMFVTSNGLSAVLVRLTLKGKKLSLKADLGFFMLRMSPATEIRITAGSNKYSRKVFNFLVTTSGFSFSSSAILGKDVKVASSPFAIEGDFDLSNSMSKIVDDPALLAERLRRGKSWRSLATTTDNLSISNTPRERRSRNLWKSQIS
jgi:hypothetical protein